MTPNALVHLFAGPSDGLDGTVPADSQTCTHGGAIYLRSDAWTEYFGRLTFVYEHHKPLPPKKGVLP